MAKHKSLLKKLIKLALSAILLLAMSILLGSVLFESKDVQRGSLLYLLGAPQYLKSVQTLEECRAPLYRWKGRDGESAPYTSLTYGSRKKIADLLQSHAAFFEAHACTAMPVIHSNHLALNCANPDFISVNVSVTDTNECQDITIDFVEDY